MADQRRPQASTIALRGRLRHIWHTVNGLVTLLDVLSKLGFWLYRGSLRQTMIVTVMLGAVLLMDQKIDAIGMIPRQVLTGTGAILIVSCFSGLLLMFISGSFALSQLTLTEAKGSNLLEEMKQSRAIEHRQRLWNRVIQYK